MKKRIFTWLFLGTSVGMLPCAINMVSCSCNNPHHPAQLDNLTRLEVSGSAVLEISGIINNNLNNVPDLWYSKNAGSSWQQIQFNTQLVEQKITLNDKDTIYLYGNNPLGLNSQTSWIRFKISSTDKSNPATVTLGGSVMSLIGDYTGQKTDIPCNWCFYNLFCGSDALTNISSTFLPATTLTSNCYNNMFSNCKSLKSIPDNFLPAKDLSNAEACYLSMFDSCKSLETLPGNLLPATKLGTLCYFQMFENCTSLKSLSDNFYLQLT